MKTETPDDYRVTEKDVDEAMKLYADHQAFLALTPEQDQIVTEFLHAEEMRQQSGTFPTLGEVRDSITKREDAYWQKHFGKNAPR